MNQEHTINSSEPLLTQDDSHTQERKLRRLTQVREAVRRNRLKKKAYIQRLEENQKKLSKLQQEMDEAKTKGALLTTKGDKCQAFATNAFMSFASDYAQWFEEQNKHTQELKKALFSNKNDSDILLILQITITHFMDIFKIKRLGANADVFNVVYGMWTSPAERCIMWIGGFRPSDILKLIVVQLELTEQQLKTIRNLKDESILEEETISQGMEKLQKNLGESLVSGSHHVSAVNTNLSTYMTQMAMAIGKLGAVQNFLYQAEQLREKMFIMMLEIFTTQQSAQALLAINDYFAKLRALSTLWLARPKQ